jgi:phenylacetate-CoA ligase
MSTATLDRAVDATVDAFATFLRTPIGEHLDARAARDPAPAVLALFRDAAATVPAYQQHLREAGVDPASIHTLDDLARVPLTTKAGYFQRHPLAALSRGGDLHGADTIALSSGSTGEPTPWPRGLIDEVVVAARFEQVFHDAFEADRRRTLAVVCFPLGTWVGGLYTTACCRHLASKGYPIITVAPGNQKAEIFRVIRTLAPGFEQTVLLGYPPFIKDVIDAGLADGIPWSTLNLKIVLAGEVFSEAWRTLIAERAGLREPLRDSASLYGTADAGVLGNETPVTIAIRRFLATRPDAARALFGEARLPTLAQYDPHDRYFEVHGDTLVVTADGRAPLVRYHISDRGGIDGYDALVARVRALGFDAEAEARRAGARAIRRLPFVHVFGRSHFAVSYYGANVFPEMVSVGLEQPPISASVTGKFVMEVREDDARDRQLHIAVELAPGMAASAVADTALRDAIAASILTHLLRLDSELASYVPAERRLPRVTLHPAGDPDYFPIGVKHRYSR